MVYASGGVEILNFGAGSRVSGRKKGSFVFGCAFSFILGKESGGGAVRAGAEICFGPKIPEGVLAQRARSGKLLDFWEEEYPEEWLPWGFAHLLRGSTAIAGPMYFTSCDNVK